MVRECLQKPEKQFLKLLHQEQQDLQRTFYAFEAIRGTWSVRALRRQIESQYYQRGDTSVVIQTKTVETYDATKR